MHATISTSASSAPAPPRHNENGELNHLAHALEGMAGALHGLHPVSKEDLETAALVARELWPVRPEGSDAHDREYEAARSELARFAAAAGGGDPQACSWAERAAQHMALALKWRTHVDHPTRPLRHPMPAQTLARIVRVLGRRYARYAPQPGANAFAA